MGKTKPPPETTTAFLRLNQGGYGNGVRSLKHLRGVFSVEVDYIHDSLLVKFNPAEMSLSEIKKHLGIPDTK